MERAERDDLYTIPQEQSRFESARAGFVSAG